MKEWWLNLSLREKQTLALGSVVIFIFLIYQLIFASVANSVDHLRDQLHKNKNLLGWMQESDKRIQLLEKNQQPHSKKTASLLSIVQDDLNQNPIAKNMTALQQADNDSIELHFQQVSFDNMMRWLITMTRQQQIIITQMTVVPSQSPGIVDVVLKLQS
jgi:type II secretory pathway component PulM